jgi:hypothetical protein
MDDTAFRILGGISGPNALGVRVKGGARCAS